MSNISNPTEDKVNITESQENLKPSFLSYDFDYSLYSVGFSNSKSNPLRSVVGSYIETQENRLSLVELSNDQESLIGLDTVNHPFPATKIKFHPNYVPLIDKSVERYVCYNF